MALKELFGSRFGHLVVVDRLPNAKDGTARWMCLCDCGQSRAISGTGLRAGRNKSCGCASPLFTSDSTKTHGMSGTRTYRIWRGMLSRCSDVAKGKTRRNYFDKGIRVCEQWATFERFFSDMGEAKSGMTLDRIDGRLGYSKENCRWATPREQANNMATNVVLHHNGKSMSVAMWAREIGVKQNTLTYRIRRGTPVDRALRPST